MGSLVDAKLGCADTGLGPWLDSEPVPGSLGRGSNPGPSLTSVSSLHHFVTVGDCSAPLTCSFLTYVIMDTYTHARARTHIFRRVLVTVEVKQVCCCLHVCLPLCNAMMMMMMIMMMMMMTPEFCFGSYAAVNYLPRGYGQSPLLRWHDPVRPRHGGRRSAPDFVHEVIHFFFKFRFNTFTPSHPL